MGLLGCGRGGVDIALRSSVRRAIGEETADGGTDAAEEVTIDDVDDSIDHLIGLTRSEEPH